MSVRVERDGRLTIVTIDRAASANALDPDTTYALSAAFDEFAADRDQWVAILTGTGDRAFCAGTDLKVRAARGRQPLPESGFGGLTRRFDLDKPVIAAVNGVALGGGFEIVLACDFAVASEHARFALSEVRHGLAALGGGIQQLIRQVPRRVAADLILTGRTVDAEEALRLNLVNAVVPHARLMGEARAWADRLLAAAPLAVQASKQAMVRGAAHASIADALKAQNDWPAVAEMHASNDAREGARAFVEKRAPIWSAS